MSRVGWYSLLVLSGLTFVLGSYLMLVEEHNKKLQHRLKAAHQEVAELEMRKQELLIEINSVASKQNLDMVADRQHNMVGYQPSSVVYLGEKDND